MQVSPSLRPPRGVNEATPVVAHSVASGLGAVTLRLSNLDLDGRLVSRGAIVVRPLYGERFRVMRVRMGHCMCMPLDAWGHDRAGVSPRYMVCESVRVVA